MNVGEFGKQKWGAGMKCVYLKTEHKIVSVNFQEQLIALECSNDIDDVIWVRFENVQLIN